MAEGPRFNDSGRNNARGSAPARTPAASLAGAPDSPLRSADSLASARKLRNAALTLLSRRDYSSSELRKKLVDRGFQDVEIASVMTDLTASGLLDDRRVAAAHVRTAARVKSRGRLRIARELLARGISREIIAEALASVEKSDELAVIRRILQRKRWPAEPTLADRRRMFQHLLRRGFAAESIRQCLTGGRSQDDEP